MTLEEKLRRKIQNKRHEMRANSANALGIAVAGAAFVIPAVRDGDLAALASLTTFAWLSLAIILHLAATAILGLLKSEE